MSCRGGKVIRSWAVITFDRQNVERQKVRLIRKLESLGLKVTVEPIEVAA